MWLDSKYILELEMTGFAKELEVGCDNKRGVMDDSKVFGSSKWKNGTTERVRTGGAADVCGLYFALVGVRGRFDIRWKCPVCRDVTGLTLVGCPPGGWGEQIRKLSSGPQWDLVTNWLLQRHEELSLSMGN